jgi:HemY protein
MFRALTLLLFLAIGVGAALWLAEQHEEFELSVGHWHAQMPATVAVLGVIVMLALSAGIALLVRWLLSHPRAFKEWRRDRRRQLGDEALERALIALSAGRHGQAVRDAERAGRLLGNPTIALWLTAQAAQASGDDAKAEAALRRLTLKPSAALIGLRGLAAREAEAGRTDAARELLAKATATDPGAVALKAVEAELAVRAHDWRAALAHARGVPQDAKARTRRAELALAVAETETSEDAKLALLKEAFEADPAFAPGIAAYARALEAASWRRRSRNVMREGWRANPHPAIAAVALTHVGSDTPESVLGRAHALAADRPEHLESRVMVARAALDAEKWKDARLQLDAAVADGSADRRIHLLRAELAERQGGNDETAREAARAAYREAGEAPGEPAWRCSSCATVHKEWTPVCDACGATLSLGWSVTPRAASVAAPLPAVASHTASARSGSANLPVVTG